MWLTIDGFLDAVSSSIPLIPLNVVDGIPAISEPNIDNDDELLNWRKGKKLKMTGSLNTAKVK